MKEHARRSVKCVSIGPTNARRPRRERRRPTRRHRRDPTNFLGLPKDDDGPRSRVMRNGSRGQREEGERDAGGASSTRGRLALPEGSEDRAVGGAALPVALEIACRDEAEGKTIVAILASHGIRYVAHPMWGAIKAEAAAALPVPPNMDKEAEVVQWKSSEYSPK